MSARFEIVRSKDRPSPRVVNGKFLDSPQPWHARFVAANGRIVWTTEQYARRNAALNAIALLAHTFRGRVSMGSTVRVQGMEIAEVRYVDERAKP